MSLTLTRLTLTDFRNYPGLVWREPGRIAVVTGPNGSGKTNLLEAVSLLTPGRGLRGARAAAFPRQGPDSNGRWAVAAQLDHGGTLREVGTGLPDGATGDRRVFRLDGAPARSGADVAATCSCVWLTPQMDRLFAEGPGSRRRFMDRLVWTLEPGHAREVAAADTATSGRNRVLAMPRPDPAWLSGLEDAMARHGIAAAAARLSLVARLNAVLADGAADPADRRWRRRTGCATPWPPTAARTPPPAPPRWVPIAPTCCWRTPTPACRPTSPAPGSASPC